MDKYITEGIATINASCFIIECLPNMTKKEVEQRTIPLVEIIRKQHPTTPIIFVENVNYDYYKLDSIGSQLIKEKNKTLNQVYDSMIWYSCSKVYSWTKNNKTIRLIDNESFGIAEFEYSNFTGPSSFTSKLNSKRNEIKIKFLVSQFQFTQKTFIEIRLKKLNHIL